MTLAIDIGNTTIHFGMFERGRLKKRFALPTHPLRTSRKVASELRARRLRAGEIEDILICSVVPKMTTVLVRALRTLGAARIRMVGADVKVPLRNRYRYPRQVGQDRLVGAYAAWRTFKRACIVADFGTAITIDLVTRNGEYLGGIIAPGLEISRDTLASRTALLPRVVLRQPPELLGRDTANSIRSGLIHGAAALCDGLVARLKRRYAPRAVVVATGGLSPLMARYAREIDHLKPLLVLEGLSYLSV